MKIATDQLDINQDYAEKILNISNQEFLNYLSDIENQLLNSSNSKRTLL